MALAELVSSANRSAEPSSDSAKVKMQRPTS